MQILMNRFGLAAMLLLASGGALATSCSAEAGCRPEMNVLTASVGSVSGISYDGVSLWITLDGRPLIHEMDSETGAIRRSIPFATPDTGGSAWDGRWLWQIAYKDRAIHRIDVRSGKAMAVIPTPGRGMCSGMTFDGRYLWVANFDDGRIYQIDQERGGQVLRTIEGSFETTGLAWDGSHLWSGLLVGTKTHDEVTPYTGFVQQRNIAAQETLQVYAVPGVGPGSSDWLPGRGASRRFWWYDGYHKRIVKIELQRRESGRVATAALLFVGALVVAGFRRSL